MFSENCFKKSPELLLIPTSKVCILVSVPTNDQAHVVSIWLFSIIKESCLANDQFNNAVVSTVVNTDSFRISVFTSA